MPDETPLSIRHPDRPAVGGVVVVQEAFGVTEHIEDVCQRLADIGWLAVAPHLFHRTGDPVLPDGDIGQARSHVQALTADGILADVDAAWPTSRAPAFRATRPASWGSAWAATWPWR